MYSREEMSDYANGAALLGDDPIAAAMFRQLLASEEGLRVALITLQKHATSIRGEQAYREFPKFVINATREALK